MYVTALPAFPSTAPTDQVCCCSRPLVCCLWFVREYNDHFDAVWLAHWTLWHCLPKHSTNRPGMLLFVLVMKSVTHQVPVGAAATAVFVVRSCVWWHCLPSQAQHQQARYVVIALHLCSIQSQLVFCCGAACLVNHSTNRPGVLLMFGISATYKVLAVFCCKTSRSLWSLRVQWCCQPSQAQHHMLLHTLDVFLPSPGPL
jgi:hypothetical protein